MYFTSRRMFWWKKKRASLVNSLSELTLMALVFKERLEAPKSQFQSEIVRFCQRFLANAVPRILISLIFSESNFEN